MAYTPTLWAKGDIVTSEKLNKIEQGIVDKVDKVNGKTLSTNDYTNEDKAKLNSLESQIDHLESLVGSPLVASTVAEMTDEDKVYVYTGSETGYQNGNWYYYNGTTWTSGGVYNSVAFETDDTLSIQGKAADAKKTGDELLNLKEDLQDIKATICEEQSTVLHKADQYVYSNGLNNAYVWLYKTPIPKKAEFSITIYGISEEKVGAVTVYFLAQNPDETFSVVDSADITTVVGENIVPIPQGLTDEHDIFIGFYSVNNGVAYNSSGARALPTTRFSYSSPLPEKITATGSFNMDFNAKIEYSAFEDHIADLQSRVGALESAEMVTVDANGAGKYTTIIGAINAEAENTVIYVKPGIYNQDMTACLKKRIILIGTDRNTCIIRDTDGRYGHHPLYISCGYFENLTIEAPYISGTSQEVGVSDLGAYAVHIDTDDDYGVGKTTEFHHCTIKSDFFPAVGLGMRKDATYIFDNCELINGQIEGRGDYSDEGTLGALYFHDSNGEQGDQYISVTNCVLRSNLKYAMCPYMVNRPTQNNRVFCDFINNVLYSEVGKYADTVWFRRSPFDPTTGIFTIGVGYGNSISSLNN